MEFICNVVWFSVYQADSCWVCFVYQLVLCYNCAPVGSMLQLCISWFCYNSASVGSMLQLCMKLCFMYKQYNSGGPRQFQCNPSFFGNPGLSTHTIGAISISRSIEGTSFRPLVWCDNCQNISDSSEAAPPISQRWLKHGWHQPEVIKTWLEKTQYPKYYGCVKTLYPTYRSCVYFYVDLCLWLVGLPTYWVELLKTKLDFNKSCMGSIGLIRPHYGSVPPFAHECCLPPTYL